MFKDADAFLDAAGPLTHAFHLWAFGQLPSIRAAADHLCYKCGSAQEFEHVRSLFEQLPKTFIYQSLISERRIAVIKLHRALPSVLGPIGFLELSDQKPDGSQTSGFDHVEVYPTNGTLDELAVALAAKGYSLKRTVRPHHTTYDGVLQSANGERFKLRLEDERLIDTIKRKEMF